VSFTARVKEEMAHVPTASEEERATELAALLRFGASLSLRGGRSPDQGFAVVFSSDSGAVARRTHAAIRSLSATRPTIEVHQPSGLRQTTRYRLRLDPDTAPLMLRLGLVSASGHPAPPTAPPATADDPTVQAYLRGAVMAAGSFSEPTSAPHAEVSAPGETSAGHLCDLLVAAGMSGARTAAHGDGWRVVLKGGRDIARLLACAGAHTSYLEWDHALLRRELRGEANRVANADRANLARAVRASSRQVESIEQLVATIGWEAIPDELRAVALARLSNPEASLAELGALLEPPLGKTPVHRRLARLVALAEEALGGAVEQ
jgi:cell division protein WhiA